MIRVLFFLCLAAALMGCGDEFVATGDDAGVGASGGSGGGDAGSGNDAGTGGSGGDAGTTSTGGTGGGGGQGGHGGNPCTGIYLSLVDPGDTESIPSGSGTTTMAEYDLYGASLGNQLNVLSVGNNVDDPPDFTTAVATEPVDLLDYVQIRCQDPSGGSSYTTACQEPLDQNGRADCTNLACYSNSNEPIRVLLQANPKSGASGEVRVGIDPSQPPGIICGGLDQATINKRTVTL